MAWWSFWALMQTMVMHRFGFSWSISLIDALVSNTLLAVAGFTALTIYKYYQPGKKNRLYRLLHGFGITILYSIALRWTLYYLFKENTDYLACLDKSMQIRSMFALLMISFITMMNWMWNNIQDQKEHDKRSAHSEQLAKDAELAKLRQQLQPHFLFNSLNSISALAGSKPQEARKMIQQLSDFLRGTLKKDDQQFVKLQEDLDHLKLYLEIEKVRFGHRLNIEIHTSEDSLQAQLPPLLLQPIVENAIKFGLYDTTGDTIISISTSIEQPYLYITIKNPFDSQTQNANQGIGFGLSSVQRRLFLLFARQDLLTTEQAGHTFTTTLKIPQTI